MKPVKRNFLLTKENLFFSEENYHQILKYFIPNNLYINNLANLRFESLVNI